MELAARIGTMARRGAPLPYLRRVAYLESDAYQVIDTGVFMHSELSFEIDVQATGGSTDHIWTNYPKVCYIYGAYAYGGVNDAALSCLYPYGVYGTLGNRFMDVSVICDQIDSSKRFIEVRDKTGVSVVGRDKIIWNPESKSTALTPITLFAILSNGRYIYSKMRCYGFKIADGEELIRDFIPVIDLSGRPCFYNQAHLSVPADDPSRFFYNQGTGEFTWGELNAA